MRALSRPLLAALAFAAAASAQSGMRDRYFARYPFEQWQSEGPAAALKWSARVQPARLSVHQRLALRVEIQIDRGELDARRSHGEIVVLVEVRDSQGRRWRTHEVFDLSRIPPDAKAQNLDYSQDAFVLPGDYRISMAVCDSQTREHSFSTVIQKVPPPKRDPLPRASADLPQLEFVRLHDIPDSWFQPYLRGRLKLPVDSAGPLHVDLVMNLTPSQRAQGSLRAFRRNMSVLVPSLRVLAGLGLPAGALDLSLLDLAARRSWDQKAVRTLDWNRLREPFASANPGIVDARQLAEKGGMLQFLWDQLLDRLRGDTPSKKALIVLSAPMFLEGQNRLEPSVLAKQPGRRVFYIRYRSVARTMIVAPDGSVQPSAPAMPPDEVERVMKLLDAKIYSVSSPEEFRRALASIITELGRM